MKDIEILEEFAKEYKDIGYFGIIKAEQIQILDNILKERQADKEKIKELYEIIINNKPHIAQQKLKLYIEDLLKDEGE